MVCQPCILSLQWPVNSLLMTAFGWASVMFASKVLPRFGLLRRAFCKYDYLCLFHHNPFIHPPIHLLIFLMLFFEWSGSVQTHGDTLNGGVQPLAPALCTLLKPKLGSYSTAADNRPTPRWVQLEPELDEALVPRKLSVSPLESWLSLRYSLPPALECFSPLGDGRLLEEKVLPPISTTIIENELVSITPLKCKNVLEIRRRKMNRHKYKKLLKRTKFLRRRVLEGRGKRKQVSLFLCCGFLSVIDRAVVEELTKL